MRKYNKLPFWVIAFSCAALLPNTAFASVTYQITANTTSVSGQSGYLDLQLEPGPVSANAVTAIVTSFNSDGTLSGAASLTGDAGGQLPGAVSFDNQAALNDFFQPTTFGNFESFDVTLNGPTPLGGGSSVFNIAFYKVDGTTPILTTSSDGAAGQITINADGTTGTVLNPATTGGASALTIASASPEPSSAGLVSIALLAALFPLLRRKRTTQENGGANPRADSAILLERGELC